MNKVGSGSLTPKVYWLLIGNSIDLKAHHDLTLFYLSILFSVFPCILHLSHTSWTTGLSHLYAFVYTFPYSGGILCPG